MAAASARDDGPPARPSFDPEAVFNQADADGDGKMSKQEFQLVVANAPGCGTTRNGRTGCSGCSTPTRTGCSRPPSSSVWPRCAAAVHRPPPRRRGRRRRPPIRSPTPPTADQVAFFEKKVRPVLVQQCYECHSAQAKKVRGGLLLDTREGTRRGGEQGPAVVPGDPEASLLVQAVRYEDENLQMPPKHRLPNEVVADLEQWVRSGAADPRDGKAVVRSDVDIEKGRQFWAFQPPKAVTAPTVQDGAWPRSDVDRFLLAAMEARGCGRWATPIGPPAPAAQLRPDRPAADAGRGRGVPGRRVARRGGKGGRSAAGVAGVRRAVGPALARRRPLRRVERQGGEPQLPARLALPRLRHRRLQRRQAVRQVHHGADRRRPDAGQGRPAAGRAGGRHGLPGDRPEVAQRLPAQFALDVADEQIDVTRRRSSA